MEKTLISIKTNKEVKENAQRLAAELGLSLSDVMNASLRNFIRTREVRVSAVPHMTLELEKLVGKAENDFKKGKNVAGPFSGAEEMDAYLDAR